MVKLKEKELLSIQGGSTACIINYPAYFKLFSWIYKTIRSHF